MRMCVCYLKIESEILPSSLRTQGPIATERSWFARCSLPRLFPIPTAAEYGSLRSQGRRRFETMGRSTLNTRTRERNNLDRTNTVTSLADRERVSRHASPYCRRNSNLPAPMRGRASVQLLPAYASHG